MEVRHEQRISKQFFCMWGQKLTNGFYFAKLLTNVLGDVSDLVLPMIHSSKST